MIIKSFKKKNGLAWGVKIKENCSWFSEDLDIGKIPGEFTYVGGYLYH
jgi:hypothetical protein